MPFSAHYGNSPDFESTVRAVLANPEIDKRISVEIQGNLLKAKRHGGEYTEGLLVNTFESEGDEQNYAINGYDVVVDMRPADTLAEIEAYCISNDGKSTVISYRDYLTLSEVARLNFDFKIKYTGNALELNDELIEEYVEYLIAASDESKLEVEALVKDLAEGKITKDEYDRSVYELYFTNYYPEISDYEATSKVPLLRNYYYHQYIKEGNNKYLFIFDDYLAGSFETKNGIDVSFYGFYGNLENGILIEDGVKQGEANATADDFIKTSYNAMAPLTLYAHAMNVFSLIPFIALMPMVVTLLAYSILKLSGVESISSLGATFKIIGSFVWFAGFISAVLTAVVAFFVQRNVISVLPLVLFFATLVIRSIIFAIKDSKLYIKQSERREAEREEG